MIRKLIFLCFAVAALAHTNICCSQDEIVLSQSRNAGFEAGLEGWDYSTLSSEIVTRDFTAAGANPWESFSGLGSNLVRLRGNGVWGQSIVHGTLELHHLLNAFVCKRSSSGSNPAGYAEIGITYYDINGNVLQNIPIEVPDADPTLNRGVGDGLVFRSWGVKAPVGAYRTFLYAYTTEGTDLYIDNFGLFAMKNRVPSPSLSKNLLFNPRFAQTRTASDGSVCVGYGSEFWETDLDWTDGFDGAFGSPLQDESAYQVIDVTPGAAFALFAEGNIVSDSNWPITIGVDFYDANWKQVRKAAMYLDNRTGSYMRGKRVVAPANAVRASVWIWCDIANAGAVATVHPRLYRLESSANSESFVSMTELSLNAVKNSFQASLTIVYSDPDGINTATIDVNDGVFKSLSHPTITYPIVARKVTTLDGGKVVVVKYVLARTNYGEVGEFRVLGNQVQDKKGNAVAAKTFDLLNLR